MIHRHEITHTPESAKSGRQGRKREKGYNLLLSEPSGGDHTETLSQFSHPLAVCDTTTTAFCTVLLVTSADRRFSLSDLICRVHAMPNRLVAVDGRSRRLLGVAAVCVVGDEDRSSCVSVPSAAGGSSVAKAGDASPLSKRAKYEKSSSMACAPSDKAMKGRSDQSFFLARFSPTDSTQNSTSGPLFDDNGQRQRVHACILPARSFQVEGEGMHHLSCLHVGIPMAGNG